MRRSDKKAQFNFVWIFAILVGGAILLFAIKGAMQVGESSKSQSNTEIAKSISILIDPLQSGFGDASFGSISFDEETRMTTKCYSEEFGSNSISVTAKSGIGEEWGSPGVPISINNKYIFTNQRNAGKTFYVFSKRLELPYKVSDMIFLTSDNYCFKDVPESIEDEILGLAIPNIEIDNCTLPNSIEVCFTSICDISINGNCLSAECDSPYDKGTVIKKGENKDVTYVGNLMYAAIFSDRLNYECNVNRLIYRAKKIAEELTEKASLMSSRGCTNSLQPDLIVWQNILNSTTADNIDELYFELNSLETKNYRANCNLW